MIYNTTIDNPDVVLIGSGIMSANLGAILKSLDPLLRIQLFELTDELAQEASHAWHNAGTGHAGICELSYTPDQASDGTVDVSKAIDVFQEFEHSKQFWAGAVAQGMIENPAEFINPVAHISFVYGQEQVDFLTARYQAMSAHHFFQEMQFTTDPEQIRQWAPLLMNGREDMPVAATKMDAGTDVNFGAVAGKLVHWLSEQPGCGVACGRRVTDLNKTTTGWQVTVRNLELAESKTFNTKFVFVGAGGGSLPLLQKSGIAESKGFGGFPIGGQWLVCDSPEVVEKHKAKVYGQALAEAPTMAVPHLDTRVIDGKKWLLFGPFGAWTTKFLHERGSWTDLPKSLKLNNLLSLMKVGISNLPLVKYLIQQGTQTMANRLRVLRFFYPDARDEDWQLIDGGIRVQAIKKEDGMAGIVHYGTEVISSADRTISALLGASPGASTSVAIMMEVVETCFPELLQEPTAQEKLTELIPTYARNLISPEAAGEYRELSQAAERQLGLDRDDV